MGNAFISASKIHDGKNFLAEESIIEIDSRGEIIALHAVGTVADANVRHYEGILCPGFVNVHCHLELSHMKGIIEEGNQLVPFLQAVMMGRNNFSEATKTEALKTAIDDIRDNGIIAVGDIANGTDTLAYRQDAGFHIHTFVESIGFTETQAMDRFAWPVKVYHKFNEQQGTDHVLRQSIVPHAPYSVSEGLFSLINNFEEYSPLSIHNEETQAENDFYRDKTGSMFDLYETLKIDVSFFQPSGKSSLQTYLPLLSEKHPLILVHNTYMNQDDIVYLKEKGRNPYLCLCPNANWYIERKMPPVDLLLNSGLSICLGTDSLASNNGLSIWSEVQTLQRHFPYISIELLLQWATYNGALALQMEDLIGSITPGKRPGINHITLQGKLERVF